MRDNGDNVLIYLGSKAMNNRLKGIVLLVVPGVIALVIVAVISYLVIAQPEREVPGVLVNSMTTILGYYFGVGVTSST